MLRYGIKVTREAFDTIIRIGAIVILLYVVQTLLPFFYENAGGAPWDPVEEAPLQSTSTLASLVFDLLRLLFYAKIITLVCRYCWDMPATTAIFSFSHEELHVAILCLVQLFPLFIVGILIRDRLGSVEQISDILIEFALFIVFLFATHLVSVPIQIRMIAAAIERRDWSFRKIFSLPLKTWLGLYVKFILLFMILLLFALFLIIPPAGLGLLFEFLLSTIDSVIDDPESLSSRTMIATNEVLFTVVFAVYELILCSVATGSICYIVRPLFTPKETAVR